MKKVRLLLSAVLGLSLLVQGFSLSAAVPAAVADLTSAAAGQMPCHDGVQTQPADPSPCCDSGCPDMANCAFGHLAAASAASLQFSPAPQVVIAASPHPTADGFSPSRLRPPIVSHA